MHERGQAAFFLLRGFLNQKLRINIRLSETDDSHLGAVCALYMGINSLLPCRKKNPLRERAHVDPPMDRYRAIIIIRCASERHT